MDGLWELGFMYPTCLVEMLPLGVGWWVTGEGDLGVRKQVEETAFITNLNYELFCPPFPLDQIDPFQCFPIAAWK